MTANPQMPITRFFQQDHEEIDRTYRDALAQAREGTLAGALRAFDDYDRRLERHIGWEEELLFPAFERANGAGGPTEVMRAEHVEIRRLKRQLRTQIAALRGPAAPGDPLWRTANELGEVLVAHNEKEERILYPLCDRDVPREERLRILGRVAAEKVPAARL